MALLNGPMPLFKIAVAAPDSLAPNLGFIDATGAIVVEPHYKELFEYREGRVAARVPGSGAWGILDEHGQWVADPRYRSIGWFAEGRCAVLDDQQRWGFIDRDGDEVIPCTLVNHWGLRYPYFSEGMCPVPRDDRQRWGYLGLAGELVIPHQFGQARNFTNELAVVEDSKERASYIDRAGAPAFAGHWKHAWAFQHGLAAAGRPKAWGVLDREGQWRHPAELAWDEQHAPHPLFSDPLACVEGPLDFHGDRAMFKTASKKWGFLDTTGAVAVPAVYDKVGYFSDGLAPVQKRVKGKVRWGLIDPTGQRIVDFIIEHVIPSCRFVDGLIPVGVRHDYGYRWGYMNRDGELVIAHRFDVARSFADGLAAVVSEGRMGYIDPRGEFIWREST